MILTHHAHQDHRTVDLCQGLPFIRHVRASRQPDIPVTYLASDTEGYEDHDFDIPEYDTRILELQAGYVDRFSPGTLIRVDAPHFMEAAVPQEIAQAARDVNAQAE